MIYIYSKSYCPYCSSAKSFLDQLGKEYTEIDLEADPEKAREIIEITGMMTVPQIFDGEAKKENFIGGYDDMMKKYEAGEIF